MESQTLELKIISANNLRKSNPFSSNLPPYVVVWFSDATTGFPAQKTPIATKGGGNPMWNHQLTFLVPSTIEPRHLILHLQILSQRALVSDDLIGEVHIPFPDLLRAVSGSLVSYQVKKPSGRPNGAVLLSYGFVDKNLGGGESDEPVVIGYPMNLYPLPPPSAPLISTEQGPVADGGSGYGYRRKWKCGYPMNNGYWYSGRMGYDCRGGFRWKPKKCRRMGWGSGCSTARWRGY